jgi:hypothetical protein
MLRKYASGAQSCTPQTKFITPHKKPLTTNIIDRYYGYMIAAVPRKAFYSLTSQPAINAARKAASLATPSTIDSYPSNLALTRGAGGAVLRRNFLLWKNWRLCFIPGTGGRRLLFYRLNATGAITCVALAAWKGSAAVGCSFRYF